MSTSVPTQLVSLQDAVAAAKNGRPEEARALLLELTERDSTNEVAWLWLATLPPKVEEAAPLTSHPQRTGAWQDARQRAQGEGRREGIAPLCAADTAVTTASKIEAPTLTSDAERGAKLSATYTILVVDDSPTIRSLVSLTLEKYGHQVMCANNGLEALHKLQDVVPDLILSDISMPHMDGYQLCKVIRSNARTKSLPIIMLSGKDGIFDKLRGCMVGATAYLTKPFEIVSLLQLITMHCQQSTEREDVAW